MKIRARKCTDPPTLKIQSKSSEWFRSHKCNANARKPETFQWNILFHTTFNGSFATLETTKHSPNIRRWSLSLADQKGTELTRKRRGKKNRTLPDSILLHLTFWQLFTLGHRAEGLNLLTHAKSHFGRSVILPVNIGFDVGLAYEGSEYASSFFFFFFLPCCQGNGPALNVH